ncbi:hypothetical protein [Lysobacter gummosus]
MKTENGRGFPGRFLLWGRRHRRPPGRVGRHGRGPARRAAERRSHIASC